MKFKKLISLLLVVMMLAALVPAAAVLAEEEQVITDKVETAKKEALIVKGGDPVSVKYDGKSHTITTPKATNSTKYTFKYSTNGGASWSTKKPSFKDIGLHKIQIGCFLGTKLKKTIDTYVNIFPKAAKVSFIASGKKYTQSLGANFTMVWKAGGYELSADFTGTEEYRPWFTYKYNSGAWTKGKPNVTIEKCGDYIIKVYAKIGTVKNQYVGTIRVSILPTVTVQIDGVKKESASFTEDGTSHKVTATLNDGGAGYKLQYYYNGKWRTAPLETAEIGSYTVKFRALNSSNEVVRIMPNEATMKIGPQLTVNDVTGVVYDGEPHMLDVVVSGGLEYSLTYSADGGKTWTKQCPILIDPGKMSVKVKLTASNGTSTTKTGTVEVKPATVTEGTVKPTTANLYAEAKADAKVLGKALKDEVCEILAVQGDWTKVRLNGTVGYMETAELTPYTRPFDPTEDPLKSGSTNSMVLEVKSGTPQAWEGPKEDGTYEKVQKLAAGGKHTVLSKYTVGSDTWYRIQVTSTKEGFVKYDSTTMNLLKGVLTQYCTITNCTTSVVVRKGAGTDYAKLGTAKKGAVFGILASSKDSKGTYWYKIQYNATTEGWVSSEYVSLGIVNPSGGETVTTGKYCTIANINEWCNVREKATTNSALLGQALLGAKYKVLGTTTDWVNIQYGEKEAWVYKKYTSIYTETEGDIIVPTEVEKKGYGFAIAVTDATVYDSIYFDHKAIGAVEDHVVCKVLAKDGNYFKIEFGDGTGYVHKSQFNHIYTADYTPATKAPTTNIEFFRQASDAPGELVGTIVSGTNLPVLGTDGAFTIVQYKNRAYYVKTADLP